MSAGNWFQATADMWNVRKIGMRCVYVWSEKKEGKEVLIIKE